MKMYFAITALFVAVTITTVAQTPSQQFGVGLRIWQSYAWIDGGPQIQYAVSSSIHVGVGLGLSVYPDAPITIVRVSPYGKFFVPGATQVRPFVIGNVDIQTATDDKLFTIREKIGPHSYRGIGAQTIVEANIGVGVEYFLTPNVGLFSSVVVVNALLTPAGKAKFGILNPSLGIEWFF